MFGSVLSKLSALTGSVCFAGRELNGATHNNGEPEGDGSPVPQQRTKLNPPSMSPPSIPLSSPTSRRPLQPRPALRLLEPEVSRLDVRMQDGQRSDATTNGEPGGTVNRAQSFQKRTQLKGTTGKQTAAGNSRDQTLLHHDMKEGV